MLRCLQKDCFFPVSSDCCYAFSFFINGYHIVFISMPKHTLKYVMINKNENFWYLEVILLRLHKCLALPWCFCKLQMSLIQKKKNTYLILAKGIYQRLYLFGLWDLQRILIKKSVFAFKSEIFCNVEKFNVNFNYRSDWVVKCRSFMTA